MSYSCFYCIYVYRFQENDCFSFIINHSYYLSLCCQRLSSQLSWRCSGAFFCSVSVGRQTAWNNLSMIASCFALALVIFDLSFHWQYRRSRLSCGIVMICVAVGTGVLVLLLFCACIFLIFSWYVVVVVVVVVVGFQMDGLHDLQRFRAIEEAVPWTHSGSIGDLHLRWFKVCFAWTPAKICSMIKNCQNSKPLCRQKQLLPGTLLKDCEDILSGRCLELEPRDQRSVSSGIGRVFGDSGSYLFPAWNSGTNNYHCLWSPNKGIRVHYI